MTVGIKEKPNAGQRREQNPNIKDELRLRLIFPDGQEVRYRVPVMKYWEYDKKEIIEQKAWTRCLIQAF
ncbi:MAG: hypothetical protein PHP26_10195 [Syntrophomonas sp.]|uniref:hypothetical protein n=1 Tax=Syntrophomonas sp. TaxID=2053627 RepID=UPI002622DE30|nr:hypothetical protein [Syntrophomonas sp.]MDD3880336.1 hypothetical protein [Syntrophomonas sp.]MDD4627110.1 hypothetical protein [Syntrophomonas sp.]